MADYLIRFIANLVPSTLNGCPSSLYKDVLVRVDDLSGLRELTNQHYSLILRSQGMFVYFEPEKTDESRFVPDAQFFLPMHMISRIGTKTTKLASEIPENDGTKH